jgi:hypothetical protein
MKMIKSLVLGSAAGLVAMSGAQAADLPVKAKAVEYVRICSLYGAGFFYIPGTDTCVKLGGYAKLDVLANTNSDDTGNTSTQAGANNRFTNGTTWRSREDLNIDTRTATEYGVVRTFFDGVFTWTNDTYSGNPNPGAAGSSIYSAIGGGALPAAIGVAGVSPGSAPNNGNGGAVAAGTVGVYYAFVQFAGFTMGKAVSAFSAPWANYPGNNYDGLVGGGGTITGVNQFTYTAQFGNGVSATVSAQDPTQYYQAGVNNLAAGGAFGTADYAGVVVPDLVVSATIDQAWGTLQGSLAAHDNHAAYYGATELTGHPDDRWGWAAQIALAIKNIPTGAGDVINVQGVYTDGATRYNIQDLAASAGANTIYGGTSVPGAYQSVGLGVAPDTIFTTGTSQQLIQTWGMRGAFNHNFDPYWSGAIYGAFAAIHYNDTSKAMLCGGAGGVGAGGSALNTASLASIAAGGTGITSCNPDYNIAQLGGIIRWTPVKNLTFSADLTYTHLDQKFGGSIAQAASAPIGKPTAIYSLADQDTLLLLLRAQKNW